MGEKNKNIIFCQKINIILYNIYLVNDINFVRIVVTVFYNKSFKYYHNIFNTIDLCIKMQFLHKIITRLRVLYNG